MFLIKTSFTVIIEIGTMKQQKIYRNNVIHIEIVLE